MRKYYKTGLCMAVLLIVGSYANATQAAALHSAGARRVSTAASSRSLTPALRGLTQLARTAAGRQQIRNMLLRYRTGSSPLPDLCQDCKDQCLFDALACAALSGVGGCPECAIICLAIEVHCLRECGKPGHPCGPASCP